MKAFFSKFLRLDWVLLVCMLLLVYMGVQLIQSAGDARTSKALQALWSVHARTAGLGIVLYVVLASIDYRKLLDLCAGPIFAVACALLLAVLLFGAERFGGRRWLWFFQPSEVAKLCVIAALAWIYGAANARPCCCTAGRDPALNSLK